VDHRVYTPREFGIPQKRKRVFIVACKKGLGHFKWPTPEVSGTNLRSVSLDANEQYKPISKDREFALSCWQEFVTRTSEFTSLPILASEFGATYPYDRRISTLKEMRGYAGAFGASLRNCTNWDSVREKLPNHTRSDNGKASPRVAEAIAF